MDLLKRHKARVLAKKQGLQQKQNEPVKGTPYELQLALLAQQKRNLKAIESHRAKADLKVKFIPEHQAYIDGILNADKGGQDDVIITMMIWCIDTGNFEQALELGAYAIKHKLVMPDGFARSVTSFLTEEVCKAVLKDQDNAAQYIEMLNSLSELVEMQDMQDVIRAKLHKTLAFAVHQKEPEHALEHFEHALELDENAGVKKYIQVLKKQLQAN